MVTTKLVLVGLLAVVSLPLAGAKFDVIEAGREGGVLGRAGVDAMGQLVALQLWWRIGDLARGKSWPVPKRPGWAGRLPRGSLALLAIAQDVAPGVPCHLRELPGADAEAWPRYVEGRRPIPKAFVRQP